MSEGGPVARVITMLEPGGYVLLDQPQAIAGVPFDFDALLVGRTTLDLIAVVDLAIDADAQSIRRRVEALGRALDVVESNRPLTIVLIGPRPPQGSIRAMAEIARVLMVGTPVEGDDASLRDALAVLLPLDITTDPAELDEASAWEERRERLRSDHPAEVEAVLVAAGRGEAAVTAALRSLLAAALEDDGEEQEDEGDRE